VNAVYQTLWCTFRPGDTLAILRPGRSPSGAEPDCAYDELHEYDARELHTLEQANDWLRFAGLTGMKWWWNSAEQTYESSLEEIESPSW